jgi:peroxiredoxin
MSGRNKLLSALAIAILVTGIALATLVQLPSPGGGNTPEPRSDDNNPVAAGKMAAGFTLQDLKGNAVSLESLRGKVVFLNVWATWCPPCREEMPSIEKLYDEFKGDKSLVILAVSQDTDGRKAVAPFVEKNGYHFPVLLDPKNEVGDEYDVSGIPETFIIDREGRIVAHHVGPFDWASADFKEALQDLIKEKAG